MKNKYFKFILIIFGILFSNSCINENIGLIVKMDKKTFENERSLWNSNNIKNYQFIYDFFDDAGPVGPIKVTVKEDEEPIIEKPEWDDWYILKNISEVYDFINGTFDYIEDVKNNKYNGFKIRSLTLKISYDSVYHYPKKVNFSVGYFEPVDGGESYTLKITEFNTKNFVVYCSMQACILDK